MSQPLQLALVASLRDALLGMTRAAGYSWDVSSDRVVLDYINLVTAVGHCQAAPFFFLEPTREGDRQFLPGRRVREDIVTTITARIDATGAQPGRQFTLGLQLAAELERALTRDLTRGGLAIDTRLRKPALFPEPGATSQLVLVVQDVVMPVVRPYGA